jgi:hypothetical protein
MGSILDAAEDRRIPQDANRQRQDGDAREAGARINVRAAY